MSPRTYAAISLGSLVPVWVYTMLVSGGLYVAIPTSLCILLVAATLYVVFGPHEEQTAAETADADGA